MFSNHLGIMPLILLSSFNVDLEAQTPEQNGKTPQLDSRNVNFVVYYFVSNKSKASRKSIPKLEVLSKRFYTVSFQIISVDDHRKDYLKLIQRTGVTLPVIRDKDHSLVEKFHPDGIPCLFLISPDGKMIYSHTGYSKTKWEHFTKYLEDVIKQILFKGRK